MNRFALSWTQIDTGEEVQVELPDNQAIRIGRSPTVQAIITGNNMISREHADAVVVSGKLSISCLEAARNPLLFDGGEHRELKLALGAAFAIGETEFRFIALPTGEAGGDAADETGHANQKVRESIYTSDQLQQAEFGNATQQIEILANLPDLIAGTTSDDELAVRVSQLLIQGIPQADAVAVVQYAEADADWYKTATGEPPKPALVKVDTRDNFDGRFKPSRRLMLKCLLLQQSAMHIWEDAEASLNFTASDGLGWAFCSPIRGNACRGWCLYVSDKGSRKGNMFVHEETLQGDLRFTELLAQFIGSVRQVRTLQTQQTRLSTFFSPKVMDNLTKGESNSLELTPAERDVTVLFCDLRGFSKRSEQLQHDLLGLLNCVSEALGVMAHGVIERDGAIADFQGDAILGFWGWPIPDAQGPWPACRAAMAIADGFRAANAQEGHRLAGLSAGIGVAHGRALAGRIGTNQQAKIGVFGPVVNQGSRLEGMTKQFGVQICIDELSAKYLREHVPPEEVMTRLLARVRPKGMATPISVYELIPPKTKSAEEINAYETAAKAVIAGKWPEVRKYLKRFPDNYGPANFLRAFLDKAPETPGPEWDGAIQLESK